MQLDHDAETPAARAIRMLGAKRIAAACDLTTNAVWKWETVGAGYIPARHQRAVLNLALALGAALSADEVIGAAAA